MVHNREDVRRHANVVAHQIALGNLQLRPEHFSKVAYLECVSTGQPQRPRARPTLELLELLNAPLKAPPVGYVFVGVPTLLTLPTS
jgi:hypothetical protein